MPDIVARIVHAIDRAESLRRTNSLASATPLSVCRTSPSQTSWTSPGVETTSGCFTRSSDGPTILPARHSEQLLDRCVENYRTTMYHDRE